MTVQTEPPSLQWIRSRVGARSVLQGRRALAVLGVFSAGLHLMMLSHGPLLLSLLMAALAFGCLLCAGRLWRGHSERTLTMIAGMNLGMLLVHAVMMAGPGALAEAGAVSLSTHHGVSEAVSGTALLPTHPALLISATAIAALEVLGALWLKRLRLERGVVREGDG
ncbi:hypothetical protein [Nesterenkonia aurantiaca]|uniref:Uncharacterized protein n=1 Tax=Nesterenkonia aurantiaca TaxID=1436010 RepID=A0A4R7G8G3_9MICC|nr:hypothetical protein [Nesterenkonia aurantiaca]TDS87776.1 hypothetical protein EV640_101572 [Nesterenkonia aurantiaca]